VFKFDKLVVAKFDAEHASSDGGAVLLKAVDRQLGVTEAVARCLQDRRQPGKVQHDGLELVRQRIFGLVCGYADCHDAARLADDAIHKWLLDRDPLAGPALASQPTLSRFENAVGPVALTRLGHALADLVIEQHRARLRGRVRLITLDLDPTDDPTHGQQEFTFFNGHYDTWCYLPLWGFVTFDDEALDAVQIHASQLTFAQRVRIAELAAKNRLPSIGPPQWYVEAGGLLSFGAKDSDQFDRAAQYVAKILNGANPADLPIQQPTRFELVINMKTAKALGLTIPQTLLLRADQVIE
jgi:hypothetical protein